MAPSESRDSLHPLINAFFSTHDAPSRQRLIARIADASNNNINHVADALATADLWEAMDGPTGSFVVELSAGPTPVDYILPHAYDSRRAHPAIIVLQPSVDDADGMKTLAELRALFGDAAQQAVIVRPRIEFPRRFHMKRQRMADWPRLLLGIRRSIHTDSTRTFLYGDRTGAAWLIGLMHAHDLAGLIVCNGHLHLPYSMQLVPLLVSNLQGTQVIALWQRSAASESDEATQFHRLLYHAATEAGIEMAGFEVSADQQPDALPEFRHAMAEVLDARVRIAQRNSVSHRFRYAGQGHAGWLTLDRFLGEEWDEEQLAIAAAPGADRVTFIREVLSDRLALLRGSIQGQEIHIETHRCGRIAVDFYPGMVDFNKPVTIFCNGKRRFKGSIEPDVETMLLRAADTWDLQNLVAATVYLTLRGDD